MSFLCSRAVVFLRSALIAPRNACSSLKFTTLRQYSDKSGDSSRDLMNAIDGLDCEMGGGGNVRDDLIERLANIKGRLPKDPMTSDSDEMMTSQADDMLGMLGGMAFERTQRSDEREKPRMRDYEEKEDNYHENGDKHHERNAKYVARFAGTAPRNGLGIFDGVSELSADESFDNGHPRMNIWRSLKDARVQRWKSARQPKNSLEQMILWTKQGKMWEYPVDNEWRMNEVEDCGFEEHVFLEAYLDEIDLPKEGPVRHFMELVAAGLSKNPFMTAATKREHLQWFVKYFDDKKDLLRRAELAEEKQTAINAP